MTHFLQSPAWQRFQESLGRTTVADSGDGWSYLAIHERGTLNTRLYTPYGPSFTSLEAFDEALTSLTQHAREAKTTFLRIEPTDHIDADSLRRRGFRPVTYQQLQPQHTLVIDLSADNDTILANMSQNSRNITRNYHKKGVTIRKSQNSADIDILVALLDGVAKRNHITAHSAAYFQAQAKSLFPTGAASLFIAEYEGKPIATALVYDSDTTRIYAHAAADDAYRKLSAGTALVGHMILDAKMNGLRYFDLYGIAPTDNPSHRWAGFTKFKKSFGGQEVTYAGAWDLPLNKLGYWVYRMYQTIRRTLR